MSLNRLNLGRLASSLAVLIAVSANCFADKTYKLIRVDGKTIVAVISPDGSKALWTSNLDGEGDIYVSNPDGTKRRNLTANCNSWDNAPDWSADGKRIAFASARTSKWQIHSMGVDGKNLQQLTHEKHGARHPKLGPHGKIAFRAMYKDVKYPRSRRSDLVVIKGNNRHALLNDISLIDFAWSPDGWRIACGAEGKLVLVNLSDGKTRNVQVTDVDRNLYNHGVFVTGWRPDGKLVACLIRYLGRRRSRETVFPGEDKLYLVAQNGEVRSMSLEKVKDDEFGWVAISPEIPIQIGKAPVDPRAEKKRVVSFFTKKGFPLKEIEPPGNVIEYSFLVGPEFKYAIGIDVLLGAAEEQQYAPGSLLRIAIPCYVKHDIALYEWDMKANGGGNVEFKKLLDQLKKALNDYPRPGR